jgi:hypothetical protein
MAKLIDWLSEYKYQVHLTTFLLMIISAVGMYLAAQNDLDVFIWVLLSALMFANLVVMLAR